MPPRADPLDGSCDGCHPSSVEAASCCRRTQIAPDEVPNPLETIQSLGESQDYSSTGVSRTPYGQTIGAASRRTDPHVSLPRAGFHVESLRRRRTCSWTGRATAR